MDPFNFFCLDNSDKAFLVRYLSPGRETSTFKKIPIAELDRTKSLLRKLGYSARIVYRGPRTNQIDPSFTRKVDAVAFTVYPR